MGAFQRSGGAKVVRALNIWILEQTKPANNSSVGLPACLPHFYITLAPFLQSTWTSKTHVQYQIANKQQGSARYRKRQNRNILLFDFYFFSRTQNPLVRLYLFCCTRLLLFRCLFDVLIRSATLMDGTN